MTNKLLIATTNNGKLKEIEDGLSKKTNKEFQILNLNDFPKVQAPLENSSTFEGNAKIKSEYYFKNFGVPCIADDSGLSIENTNFPGIQSARYANENGGYGNAVTNIFKDKNSNKIVARFDCVISLYDGTKHKLVYGTINGQLIKNGLGENGFGYDPYFIPKGYSETFAQMSKDKKNSISHRYIALTKLINVIESSMDN